MATLSLVVRCDGTQWGETIAVLGSWCDWKESSTTAMATSEKTFPGWRGVVLLPDKHCDSRIEYKYVVVKDGNITRWEAGDNRSVKAPPRGAALAYDDGVFGDGGKKRRMTTDKASRPAGKLILPDARECVRAAPTESGYRLGDDPPSAVASHSRLEELPALERALVRITGERRSWRQRLQFVRDLLVDGDNEELVEARKQATEVSGLAVIAAYLSFLSSGQLPCAEDGGHHRPNHHAGAARAIEHALAKHAQSGYAPFVARRIYPMLPSYASQFTASTPLTRIRDIAHRGDIPHDLKQEIKHTLQNKLHRCAGPEDLVTCKRILERVSHGGYSEAFVHELRLFYNELQEFFNAANLDDRLSHLERTHADLRRAARHLQRLKAAHAAHTEQLAALTALRAAIASSSTMKPDGALPDEELQRIRLSDIALEAYAFPLLGAAAAGVEDDLRQGAHARLLGALPDALAPAFDNIAYSGVRSAEALAIAAELRALGTCDDAASALAPRAKAAAERAAAFADHFAAAAASLFGGRVVALAHALGVEARAGAVFAESEIRATVAFQASRIAGAAARACRRVLKMAPWDALYAGVASGRVVYVERLADVRGEDGDVVVVARDADGEEDIAGNVVGVVLGRPMAHLSHLGVRARQAGVVFVCAEEGEAFEGVWAARFEYGRMEVDARSGLIWKRSALEKGKEKKKVGKVELNEVKRNGDRVVSIDNTTKMNASDKSAFVSMMSKLAKKSALFVVPHAACVTHAAFALHCGDVRVELDTLVRRYQTAWKSGDGVEQAAKAVRASIERRKASKQIVDQVRKELGAAKRVMVRSSANAEDLDNMSGAGLYDTITNVKLADDDALARAIAQVWGSVWTTRAASSRMTYGVSHNDVSMAVLVQKMVIATLSFVAFSRDPVHGDSDDIYIEVAVGMGETLASGASRGAPYRLRVQRASMRVETVAFASISDELVPDDAGLCARVVDYSQQRMTTDAKFREGVAVRVAQAVVALETKMAKELDVEGALVVRGNTLEVYVVQARPQIV